MPTSTLIYPIFLGTPAAATSSLILVETGPAGTSGAARRLVHPDSTNFSPLVYARNPDRTVNFDQIPLLSPIVSVQRTIGGTRVTRFEMLEEDVVVAEVWLGGDDLAPMTAAQFRLLYELVVNPVEFDPLDPVYVIWEPRDRSDLTYEVELLGLTLGGDGYDVREFRALGGAFHGGDVKEPVDSLDTVETGLFDREVRLTMRIVAVVE